MGIDKKRFTSKLEEEYFCPLCNQVFEDPVQGDCQHDFCRKCIEKRLETNKSCPTCRKSISEEDLKTNNLLVKLLSKLQLTCQLVSLGCGQIITWSSISSHTAECVYNSGLKQPCVNGCGTMLTKEQAKSHRCVETLSKETLSKEIAQLKEQMKKIQVKSEKNIYFVWLLKFPETTNLVHRAFVEELKMKDLITDWKTEAVILRCVTKSQLHTKYFEWMVPTVLSTIRDNLKMGSICVVDGDWGDYLIYCCALMIGPNGWIFTTFDADKESQNCAGYQFSGEKIFNKIEIDYQNGRMIDNGQEITGVTFDCMIFRKSDPTEAFLERLKPGGRMIKLPHDALSFGVVEKLLDGSVKRRDVNKG